MIAHLKLALLKFSCSPSVAIGARSRYNGLVQFIDAKQYDFLESLNDTQIAVTVS
jgi:hypothetical protein